ILGWKLVTQTQTHPPGPTSQLPLPYTTAGNQEFDRMLEYIPDANARSSKAFPKISNKDNHGTELGER
ncbi:hypothetical protein HispidOSU_021376, partial [Sigmodon hispidus]